MDVQLFPRILLDLRTVENVISLLFAPYFLILFNSFDELVILALERDGLRTELRTDQVAKLLRLHVSFVYRYQVGDGRFANAATINLETQVQLNRILRM